MLLRERSITKDVREMLKSGTMALHRQAEAALEAHSAIETEAGLSHFLFCMLKAHSHFSSDYDQASTLACLEPRSESLIAAMLTDLNLQKNQSRPIANNNDNVCLGVGYVFEGSALGASILTKRLGSAEFKPPKYLSLMSTGAKSRWPRFLKTLDSCPEEEDVLKGAVDTFNYIIAQAENYPNGIRN